VPAVNNGRVNQVVTDFPMQPVEMGYVRFANIRSELCLKGDYPVIVALDDEIDRMVAVLRAQVVDVGLGCPGIDTQAQRDERLEESAEQRQPGIGSSSQIWLSTSR
jgi:hypothetical protein